MNPTNGQKPRLLKEAEVAERYNLSVKALQRWRGEGIGPAFIKLNNSVRYDPADVENFISRNRVQSTAEFEALCFDIDDDK